MIYKEDEGDKSLKWQNEHQGLKNSVDDEKPTSRLWSKWKTNAIVSPSDVAHRTSISQHNHDTWKALTEANIKWTKADVRIVTSNKK